MAAPTHEIYLEVGKRRVFAAAIDWPGWCRSGRDEDSAVQWLVEYGPRYADALRTIRSGFKPPVDGSSLDVVERLEGNATTDFGAPAMAPASDERQLDEPEAKRLTALLKACWEKLDRAVETASGAVLRKGPRGGGRELDGIVRHVIEADGAYLRSVGGTYRRPTHEVDLRTEMAQVRDAALEALASRVRGDPLPQGRRGKVWTPRYFVRRTAWHSLDHAWEVEDRADSNRETQSRGRASRD